MEEKWRIISEADGKYSVSDKGRVKSNPGVTICKNGQLKKRKGRVLKQSTSSNYNTVTYFLGSKKTTRTVHRLVAQVFCPNINSKEFVNHIDGDKRNNNSANLEWVTASENLYHAVSIGKMPHGENHYLSKVGEIEILTMFTLYKNGFVQKDFSSRYKMRQTSVSRILNGSSHKWITKHLR